jgi:short-subunit dehydrogenase
MFSGTVHTTLAALPHIQKRPGSTMVNITSIGGKVSVPHLLPYSCAKFAAPAYSEGLRAELQSTGIRIVTIVPGLMRTGSYLNASVKGETSAEAAWFSLGSTLPGISMSAERAASQIIAAARSGRAERILSTRANLLARFQSLAPGLMSEVLVLVNRLLPSGNRD